MAGGYAKRLWPLTMTVAKPLLPLGKKRIIDYIMDKLVSLKQISRIIVSANMKFKNDFEKWAEQYSGVGLELVYDQSYSEDEKPGALRALSDIVSGMEDDCLVITGDNFFTDDLRGLIEEHMRREATVIGLYVVGDLELAKNYGVVSVGENFRITSFEEKPEKPRSTLISTGIYLFPKSVLPSLREYIESGNNPDQLGRFIKWLIERKPVYGYMLSGEWYDIGTHAEYRRVIERFSITGTMD